jgi:hypothetical protein
MQTKLCVSLKKKKEDERADRMKALQEQEQLDRCACKLPLRKVMEVRSELF